MRKAILKVIFVLNIWGKTIAQTLDKYSEICDGLDANIATLPTPDPATSATRDQIQAVKDDVIARQNLWNAADAKTVSINKGMSDLNVVFVNDYMGYVQKKVADNKAVGIAVGYGVKKPGTAAPDTIAPPQGVVTSQGKTPDSLMGHCDSYKGLGVKEIEIQICLNPRATPELQIWVHKMFTGDTSQNIPALPLNTEVGVRYVFIGKKAGVESLPSDPFIRRTS